MLDPGGGERHQLRGCKDVTLIRVDLQHLLVLTGFTTRQQTKGDLYDCNATGIQTSSTA
jgi:hypothetical protein